MLALGVLSACGRGTAAPGGAAGVANERPVVPADAPLVVFLGDSLAAGLHLDRDDAFPAVLQRRLAAAGLPFRLVNAGVSGNTSAGGVTRLDWLLRQKPAVVVVELGANDGLRGQPVEDMERNLRRILGRVQAAGARPLLLGMRLPPNYGAPYAGDFAGVFPRLAEEFDVPLVPFLLEGVAGRPSLNLPDGIHPTVEGHGVLADNVEPALRKVLEGIRR